WPERVKDGVTVTAAGLLLIGSTACSAFSHESGPEPTAPTATYPTDDFDDSCEIITNETITKTEELFVIDQAEGGSNIPKWKIAEELGLLVYDFTDSKYESFSKATYELYNEEVSIDEAIDI